MQISQMRKAAGVAFVGLLSILAHAQVPVTITPPNVATECQALLQPAIRAELQITEAQKTEIETIGVKVREAMQTRPDMQGVSTPEEAGQIVQEHFDQIEKEFGRAIAKLLTEPQAARLKQILLQRALPSILLKDDVSKALQLTSEQRSKIRTLTDAMRSKMLELSPARTREQGASREITLKSPEISKLIEKTRGECLDLLSAEQRETWKRLLGPEFKREAPKGR